ncbi:hypothetical protein N0V82_000419 [Gnomoniopsis sp. IMI 355080]|nr:hypothetical protein N0V82_000419 [Gnomoniopsis sp. IMI 355080]
MAKPEFHYDITNDWSDTAADTAAPDEIHRRNHDSYLRDNITRPVHDDIEPLFPDNIRAQPLNTFCLTDAIGGG